MSDRRPLSKRTRFEVFKRDDFTCMYCGSTPPRVILHVDHMTPVAEGGLDDMDNLVTACMDCNLGKGAVPLHLIPESLRDRAALVQEREDQLRGYQEVLEARRARLQAEVQRVVEIYEQWVDGYTVNDSGRISISQFIDQLGVHEVMDSMSLACDRWRTSDARTQRNTTFRYFCGICWRKIKDD